MIEPITNAFFVIMGFFLGLLAHHEYIYLKWGAVFKFREASEREANSKKYLEPK